MTAGSGAKVLLAYGDGATRDAVLPHAMYQEYCVADTPINRDLTQQTQPLDAEGCVAVPTGPGLGVEIDPAVLERYRVG